jgi:hypothetical protein
MSQKPAVWPVLLSLLCTASLAVAAKDAAGKPAGGAPGAATPATGNVFFVYADKGDMRNHYAPSGWMGDYGDLRIDDGSKEPPVVGKTSFKVIYSAQAKQGANWAGIYWQHPPNNWGSKPGGYDLSGYKRVTFQARGAKGGEKVADFKIGGITGEQGDSDSAATGPVELTKQWKTYTIDLAGKNLTHIAGGFCWVANRDDNPQGFTIYLDDIKYEK